MALPTNHNPGDTGHTSEHNLINVFYNAHPTAATGVHGVTGNIVGDADTQSLTNKTFLAATGSTPGAVVKGASSQSASLVELRNNSNVVLPGGFDANGQVIRPYFVGVNTGSPTITTSTPTAFTLTPIAALGITQSTARISFTYPGFYRVSWQWAMTVGAGSTSGICNGAITKNAAGVYGTNMIGIQSIPSIAPTSGNQYTGVCTTGVLQAAVNDYIECWVLHNGSTGIGTIYLATVAIDYIGA